MVSLLPVTGLTAPHRVAADIGIDTANKINGGPRNGQAGNGAGQQFEPKLSPAEMDRLLLGKYPKQSSGSGAGQTAKIEQRPVVAVAELPAQTMNALVSRILGKRKENNPSVAAPGSNGSGKELKVSNANDLKIDGAKDLDATKAIKRHPESPKLIAKKKPMLVGPPNIDGDAKSQEDKDGRHEDPSTNVDQPHRQSIENGDSMNTPSSGGQRKLTLSPAAIIEMEKENYANQKRRMAFLAAEIRVLLIDSYIHYPSVN